MQFLAIVADPIPFAEPEALAHAQPKPKPEALAVAKPDAQYGFFNPYAVGSFYNDSKF